MFYFDFPIQIQSLLNHYWLLVNYLLFFLLFFLAYIAYKKPLVASGILIILFPAYLFRAKIFGLPTTFLELAFIIVFATWILKSTIGNQQSAIRYKTPLFVPILLFVIASTLSIFVAPDKLAALGLWKAYFIEPILFFFMLIHTIKTEKDKEFIFWCLGISTIPLSLLAIFQKFTGWGIAEPMWVGESARRVTAIFTSPNAVGLYLGPIAVIYFGWLIQKVQNSKFKVQSYGILLLILLLNIFAILFTKSQGAWIGVAVGIIILCYFLINKKWTAISVAAIAIAISLIPQTQKMILPYITFSDSAGQNRLLLWRGSMDYLLASPKNFFFGAGIYGFPQVQEKFRDPKKTEPLIYPHNIFLNFWMEIGLLGLIAIIWILSHFLKTGYKNYKLTATGYRLIIMAAMLTIIVHGLFDVPYLKNDLSLLFWTIISLAYIL